MNLNVLLSSGETDEWEDVGGYRVAMELAGALIITDSEGSPACVYAGGMWMKVEPDGD